MAIKKILLSVVPVALLVGCATMGLSSCGNLESCDEVARTQNLTERKEAIQPVNYNPVLTYPNQIDLVGNYTYLSGYVYGDPILVDIDQNSPVFDYNYSYIAVKAYGSWSGDTFTLTSVAFAKFNSIWYQSLNFNVPYAFMGYSPSSNVYYLYQNCAVIDTLPKMTVGSSVYYPRGSGYSGNNSADVLIMNPLTTVNAGPYEITLDVPTFLQRLEPQLINHFMTSAQDYSAGYNRGYNDGKNDAEQSYYDEGYQQGLHDAGESAPLISLFSAIVGVPISLLNGLTPLAIWNIPIISILITFVFMGLVLWVVRKFFAK